MNPGIAAGEKNLGHRKAIARARARDHAQEVRRDAVYFWTLFLLPLPLVSRSLSLLCELLCERATTIGQAQTMQPHKGPKLSSRRRTRQRRIWIHWRGGAPRELYFFFGRRPAPRARSSALLPFHLLRAAGTEASLLGEAEGAAYCLFSPVRCAVF